MLVGAVVACSTESGNAPSAGKGAPAAVDQAEGPSLPTGPLPTRASAMLARSFEGNALYVADEDHDVVRRVALPLDDQTPPDVLPMPGHPTSVLTLRDRVVVAVRDPGFVVSLVETPAGLLEIGRTAVPADAWGMAVSADERTLLVSSAWAGELTAIDLPSMTVRWSTPVAREPRGIAILSNGAAYVSHLMGTDLTKIADANAKEPVVTRVALPASPIRAPIGFPLGASLGYALALSPDEHELYVPRHALGAQGLQTWFGAETVDVLETTDDTPLAVARTWSPELGNGFSSELAEGALSDTDGAVPLASMTFTQPRAVVYRKSTDTLVVASEGLDHIVELDAQVPDPSVAVVRIYGTSMPAPSKSYLDPNVARVGGAPSAIVLSSDEEDAYVYARSTDDIVHIELQGGAREEGARTLFGFVHLADGTLSPEAEMGRRLFYDATDGIISGGLGCAGCHPDGRDDGFVWSETEQGFRGGPRPMRSVSNHDDIRGFPRQTPMLAGRVGEPGAYGWHGESRSLEARVATGFTLHQWSGGGASIASVREKDIGAFLRTGLVTPPHEDRPLTEQETHGKRIFESESTACATCHVPSRGFTDRSVVALDRDPELDGFRHEADRKFKTPSLRFVGGTPPYFHDGAAKTLEDVVEKNDDRMGHTSQLTREERQALVAYLRTL